MVTVARVPSGLFLRQIGQVILTGDPPGAEVHGRRKARAVGHHGVVLPTARRRHRILGVGEPLQLGQGGGIEPASDPVGASTRVSTQERWATMPRASRSASSSSRVCCQSGVDFDPKGRQRSRIQFGAPPTLSISPVTTPSRCHCS